MHLIWHSRRGRQRNHLWQIFWWSVERCRFCGWSKIALSHWQSQWPLTQGWRYRAACDLGQFCGSNTYSEAWDLVLDHTVVLWIRRFLLMKTNDDLPLQWQAAESLLGTSTSGPDDFLSTHQTSLTWIKDHANITKLNSYYFFQVFVWPAFFVRITPHHHSLANGSICLTHTATDIETAGPTVEGMIHHQTTAFFTYLQMSLGNRCLFIDHRPVGSYPC